jgi:E3 ubiquitin-protein ligase TRIP12
VVALIRARPLTRSNTDGLPIRTPIQHLARKKPQGGNNNPFGGGPGGGQGDPSSALQSLLRKLGAGLEDVLPGLGGGGGALTSGRLRDIIAGLRAGFGEGDDGGGHDDDDESDDEDDEGGGGRTRRRGGGGGGGAFGDGSGAQMAALSSLCDLLAVASEEALVAFPTETVVPLLVRALSEAEHSPDTMLLAARALTFLADALPPPMAVSLVRHGAPEALCAKLLSIEYIDLAEQSLQALEKLSHDHPGALLRAGGLVAALSYLDFFPAGVQRSAAATAANICAGLRQPVPGSGGGVAGGGGASGSSSALPPEHAAAAREAAPLLVPLLRNADARVVDSAAAALAHVAAAAATLPSSSSSSTPASAGGAGGASVGGAGAGVADAGLLEALQSAGLVDTALDLVSVAAACGGGGAGGNGGAHLSPATYYGLVRVLAMCASGSAAIADALLASGVADTVQFLLAGSPLLEGSGGSAAAAGGAAAAAAAALASPRPTRSRSATPGGGTTLGSVAPSSLRTPDQLYDVLGLVQALLPPVPDAPAAAIAAASAAQQGQQQQQPQPPPPRPDSSNGGGSFLRDNPDAVASLCDALLPLLLRAHGASVLPAVRLRCLAVVSALLHAAQPNGGQLASVLVDLPVSAFLAALLGGRDMRAAAYALQSCDLLMRALPAVFGVTFVKEGVVHALEQLALKKPAAGAGGAAAGAAAAAAAEGGVTTRARSGTAPASEQQQQQQQQHQEQPADAPAAPTPTPPTVSLREAVAAGAAALRARYFASPASSPPPPPSGRSGGGGARGSGGGKASAPPSSRRRSGQEAHDDQQQHPLETDTLRELRALAARLGRGDATAAPLLLRALREGDASTFELLSSGAAKALAAYLRGDDLDARYGGSAAYAQDKALLERRDARVLARMRALVEVSMAAGGGGGGEGGRSALGDLDWGGATPAADLVRRLQAALAASEAFPVVQSRVGPSHGAGGGRSAGGHGGSSGAAAPGSLGAGGGGASLGSGLAALAQPFKLRLARHPRERGLREYPPNVVLIEPLAAMSAVEDFLWPRVQPPPPQQVAGAGGGGGAAAAASAAAATAAATAAAPPAPASTARAIDGAGAPGSGSGRQTRASAAAAAAAAAAEAERMDTEEDDEEHDDDDDDDEVEDDDEQPPPDFIDEEHPHHADEDEDDEEVEDEGMLGTEEDDEGMGVGSMPVHSLHLGGGAGSVPGGGGGGGGSGAAAAAATGDGAPGSSGRRRSTRAAAAGGDAASPTSGSRAAAQQAAAPAPAAPPAPPPPPPQQQQQQPPGTTAAAVAARAPARLAFFLDGAPVSSATTVFQAVQRRRLAARAAVDADEDEDDEDEDGGAGGSASAGRNAAGAGGGGPGGGRFGGGGGFYGSRYGGYGGMLGGGVGGGPGGRLWDEVYTLHYTSARTGEELVAEQQQQEQQQAAAATAAAAAAAGAPRSGGGGLSAALAAAAGAGLPSAPAPAGRGGLSAALAAAAPPPSLTSYWRGSSDGGAGAAAAAAAPSAPDGSPLAELLTLPRFADLSAPEACRDVVSLLVALEAVNRHARRLLHAPELAPTAELLGEGEEDEDEMAGGGGGNKARANRRNAPPTTTPSHMADAELETLPREAFVSPKLGSKLSAQLKDVLATCGGGLPAWCAQLASSPARALLPFEARRRFFYSTAFGLARALQHLQQQQAAESAAAGAALEREGRDLRIGRLQRQKVRVSRRRVLDSAQKVMELYAKAKAVLEIEYFGEVGTGLGPTLEFYTLLSHELQRRELGMWRHEEREEEEGGEGGGGKALGGGGSGKSSKGGPEPMAVDGEPPGADSDDAIRRPGGGGAGALAAEAMVWHGDDGSARPGAGAWGGGGAPTGGMAAAAAPAAAAARLYVNAPNGLFPRPYPPNDPSLPAVCERFRLLGRTVGKAVQDARLLDLPLGASFWRAVRGHCGGAGAGGGDGGGVGAMDLQDVAAVDPALGASLERLAAALAAYKQQQQASGGGAAAGTPPRRRSTSSAAAPPLLVDGCTLADLCLTYTLPGQPDYPLSSSASGSTTIDSPRLLEQWLRDVRDAVLGSGVKTQLAAFRSGLEEVLPLKALDSFADDELEALVCGAGERWTAQSLAEAVRFDHGYTLASAPARRLLEVLSELDGADQRRFLRFVTGCPRLPPGGLAALQPRLTVVRKAPSDAAAAIALQQQQQMQQEGGGGDGGGFAAADGDLPSAMTCVNYLKLPPYSSKEAVRDRLLYAIREGQGSFDLS